MCTCHMDVSSLASGWSEAVSGEVRGLFFGVVFLVAVMLMVQRLRYLWDLLLLLAVVSS